jgi:putative membrane protein
MFGYGFGFMGLGMILVTLVWIALIAVVIWAVSRLFQRHQLNDHDTAVEVLRRRYATGEISAAEYEQALKTLG